MAKEAAEPILPQKTAGFEVADRDPTPLFESPSLCGIFDVRGLRVQACLCVCI